MRRLTAVLALVAASVTSVPLCAQEGALPPPPGTVQTPYVGGTYRALVIGNDAYRDPEGIWRPLKTAVNDASAVARTLRDAYGFGEVRLLKNATRSEVTRALNELAETAQGNDSVLIYYAGHGYQRERTREGFWIPVDAVGRDDSTFVPNVVIKAKVEVIAERARHVLLVSDSCFSGALLREGGRGMRLEDKTPGYYQSVARKKSVQVLAAGGLEYVDDNYRDSGHSPFTYFFLNELRLHAAKMLEATELSQVVARNVANNVAQTPERGILYGAGHEGGEFLLVKTLLPEPAPVVAVPPARPASPPPETTPRPQAALPLPVAPVVIPAMTAGGGGSAVGPVLGFGGGIPLLIYAGVQYSQAVDLNRQSQETAKSDPAKSKTLQNERDTAATQALAAGVVGLGLTIWGIASSAASVAMQEPAWQWVPAVAVVSERPAPRLLVRYRW
jgi:hypothetical protein